jgi:hypothetical protein
LIVTRNLIPPPEQGDDDADNEVGKVHLTSTESVEGPVTTLSPCNPERLYILTLHESARVCR